MELIRILGSLRVGNEDLCCSVLSLSFVARTMGNENTS